MVNPKYDLTGRRFGKLVVLELVESEKPGRYWRCDCDCGAEKVIRGASLVSGATKSCGCYSRERVSAIKIAKKHDMSSSRIYITHRNMLRRCCDPKDKKYYCYGGKGVKVCEEWHDFKAFYVWAMVNGYDDSLTIDRIDNSKGYCPENCRFVTRAENNRNRYQEKRRIKK